MSSPPDAPPSPRLSRTNSAIDLENESLRRELEMLRAVRKNLDDGSAPDAPAPPSGALETVVMPGSGLVLVSELKKYFSEAVKHPAVDSTEFLLVLQNIGLLEEEDIPELATNVTIVDIMVVLEMVTPSADNRRLAATAIWYMAQAGGNDAVQSFVENDVYKYLLTGLKDKDRTEGYVEAALGALSGLCATTEGRAFFWDQNASHGGVRTVLDAIGAYPDKPLVQEYGASALREMSKSSNLRESIDDSGGLSLMLKALRDHINTEAVVWRALSALANMSIMPSAKAFISSKKGVELILSALAGGHSNHLIAQYAIGALRNLNTNNKDIKLAIVAAGGLSEVQTTMKTHIRKDAVQDPVVSHAKRLVLLNSFVLIGGLCRAGKEVQDKVILMDFVQLALDALRQEPMDDPEVVREIWTMFTHLGFNNDEVSGKLVCTDGFPRLLKTTLIKHHTNEKVLAAASLALIRLTQTKGKWKSKKRLTDDHHLLPLQKFEGLKDSVNQAHEAFPDNVTIKHAHSRIHGKDAGCSIM